MPVLDVATRWNSSYNMLRRLLELKDFCQEIEDTNSDMKLSDSVWEGIADLCHALETFNDITIKIQHEQLTISDFYGQWLRCKKKIESINSTFSKKLLAYMIKREDKILKNEVLISCVLLDPRYSFLLTPDEKNVGKRHLNKLHYVINNIKNGENKTNSENDTVVIPDDDVEEINLDEFETMLEREEKAIRANSNQSSFLTSSQTQTNNIESIINDYIENIGKTPRLQSSANILEYWNLNKNSKPELYQLSQILMAVPATQVSVERLFSNLAFIYNPLRSRLSENVLEAIILIRSNHNFKL